jgi:transcriptional regulator with XRE-family HTH domain
MIVHTHVMAEKRNPLGPTGETVRANLKRLRGRENLGYAQLSRRLDEVGRLIPDLGLRRIESGDRRVDVDDLMALAAALDVSPATLLMPDTTAEGWETTVETTGQPEGITAQHLWLWLSGVHPPRRIADHRDYVTWLASAVPSPYLASRIATTVVPPDYFARIATPIESVDHGDD